MLTGVFSTMLIPETNQKSLEVLSNESQEDFIQGTSLLCLACQNMRVDPMCSGATVRAWARIPQRLPDVANPVASYRTTHRLVPPPSTHSLLEQKPFPIQGTRKLIVEPPG